MVEKYYKGNVMNALMDVFPHFGTQRGDSNISK